MRELYTRGHGEETPFSAQRLAHRPMIPAKTPLVGIHLDDHDRDRTAAEQPPPLFDTPFAPKIGAHNEAEPSKLIFLVLLHVIFVQNAGLHVQFGDESVHPHVRGTNDCRSVLIKTTDDADCVAQRIIARSRIFHREILVEHLSDDPMKHGFDIDGHSVSLARANKPSPG
jgi:hypothetical protein